MIDVEGERNLSILLAALKRNNPEYYQQLAWAIQSCVDPEMRTLVIAPSDKVQNQQGRVQFATDLMQIVANCDKNEMARERVTTQPVNDGGWAHG